MPRKKDRTLEAQFRKEREQGWNDETLDYSLGSTRKLPEYNSLADRNMAAYYEKRTVRTRMKKKGFMDENGRTFDIDRKKGAINVIEQEFKKAQKEERTRKREEEELRRRIQAHRRAILENEQRERMLEDMKADRALGAEVVRMSRAVIQPELNPSVASTMTEESVTMGSEDMEDAAGAGAGMPEAAKLQAMSEQEKKLMGAVASAGE